MTINELLDLAKDHVSLLHKYMEHHDVTGLQTILNCPQPGGWVITRKSKVGPGEYQSNKVALIEGLMSRIFGDYTKEILNLTISQDKGKFAVTANVEVSYKQFAIPKYVYGVATVIAPTIDHLELATPKAVSMAFKNACKNIGSLFGKDLNREMEDDDLPTIQVDKGSSDDTIFQLFLDNLQLIHNKIEAERFIVENGYGFLRHSNRKIVEIMNKLA